MKVIVVTGGSSSEREVSLASGLSVLMALRDSGFDVRAADPVFGKEQPDENVIFGKRNISRDFPSASDLKKYNNRKTLEFVNSELFDNADIVFIALHGKFGEDGRIQSLLEMRGVKYTGSGVTASAMAMDKNVSKIFFKHYGVPTPEWLLINRDVKREYSTEYFNILNNNIRTSLGYPLVVKPNDEGSTVGLTILYEDNVENLTEAFQKASAYSDRIIIERYIDGKELTVGILGEEALPVVEIRPKHGFYDYEHKYTKGMTDYICPAELPAEISDELKRLALLAHNSLGCRVYSRVDFRLSTEGEISCLEINTLPGMTELSLVPKSAHAAGISFPGLVKKIIELSLS
ncbi:MAG: D-alanine--D-alanine ligase [Ignavibacteria bacterium]|nr:D-alanine--D-alanine ligase [Ignavibacteria bacterium]